MRKRETKESDPRTSLKATKVPLSSHGIASEHQQMAVASEAIGSILKEWARGVKERLERWTIEKVDEEAGVVRIERVKMHGKLYEEKFKNKLSKSAGSGSDNLSLWDISTDLSVTMPLEKLRKKLAMRKNEAIWENMVFWILIKGEDSVMQVYPATQAARELVRDLYLKVSGVEPGE